MKKYSKFIITFISFDFSSKGRIFHLINLKKLIFNLYSRTLESDFLLIAFISYFKKPYK
jgi:hypothetical protein